MEKRNLVDLHCDTIVCRVALSKGAVRLAQNDCHIDMEKLQHGGAMLQCMAAFCPTEPVQELFPVGDTPEAIFEAACYWYARELKDTGALRVLCFSDIEKNRAQDRISFLFTLEDCGLLRGKIGMIEEIYRWGVRMAGLTWNFPNCVGFPNSKVPEEMEKGLTDFGFEAVERMQEMGIVVDVSHLSDGGFFDVARTAKKPFIASHSDARALCPASRNLTDAMLKALADAGGVTGLNFCAEFLREGAKESRIEDIVLHALHIKSVAGIEALAFGSDFDGIDCALEFSDYAGYPQILRALERRFTPREMDLICRENALRVLKDCLK